MGSNSQPDAEYLLRISHCWTISDKMQSFLPRSVRDSVRRFRASNVECSRISGSFHLAVFWKQIMRRTESAQVCKAGAFNLSQKITVGHGLNYLHHICKTRSRRLPLEHRLHFAQDVKHVKQNMKNEVAIG